MAKPIDTLEYSARLRTRAINVADQKVLISRLSGTLQEHDLTTPVNCGGYGRIRHFRLDGYADWSTNPLPIVPACKALQLQAPEVLRAQVFQNNACNWRCWYCYVDFSLLAANPRTGAYFTADELIELYLAEPDRPIMIDLTGGQPDLVPEWVVWMMDALTERGLANHVFLWSDDNLSNRYFWQYLSPEQRQRIAGYPIYARVGCFKGIDPDSFVFNTSAAEDRFDEQFRIFADLIRAGLDMYAYVTFTALPTSNLDGLMNDFVDRLQAIHPNLPLRTVPLKIEVFSPTQGRIGEEQSRALAYQHEVHATWVEQLHQRFTNEDRTHIISDVSLQ